MKKVLFVFSYRSNNIGGISTIIESYIHGVEEFSSNGYSLDVLNIPLMFNLHSSKLNNIAYIFVQRKAVRKHLKANKYDIVHIHTSREYIFLKDILLAKMVKQEFHIPVAMTIHVGAMETIYHRISWFKNKSVGILNKYIDKTIFLSKVMRDQFVKHGLQKERSSVLYNFHNLSVTATSNNQKSNKLNLLFVGRIEREKGILELLNALVQLPELNFHLNICGKLVDSNIKDDVDRLKKELGDKVSFLGYVVGKEKTVLFSKSDMLILPSYHEGLPIVIMEALAAGCAIMSTKVGAIPEILTKDNCYWVRIASISDIVTTLKNININDLNVQKYRNSVLAKKFSFGKHVSELTNIFNTIIG